ncbi:hypothetical protein TI39_contig614g00012 [Zymoseptoria brevis]|uniref:Extracellular membrane protein CFEM domain-containing protein n=1 Tax=Zymoseptoria brevis TaxID=1047168 RepID=A0A0F4GH22_9PEZI|nr:hypothetical protein TI39_contig614g00012 [Zymoseptoria brevis]
MHATTAVIGLLSALAIARPAPSEVDEDDLWGNCDVFSKPSWVQCTCSQTKPKQLEDCRSVCLEYFREGGDLKKLKDACGY